MNNCVNLIRDKNSPKIALCSLLFALCALPCLAATVVQRGSASTAARPTATRANNAASRMPTAQIRATNNTSVTTTTDPDPVVTEPVVEPVIDEAPIIENKSSQFDKVLNNVSTNAIDAAADARADTIRNQRAALDAAAATSAASKQMENALAAGASTCDTGLRDCMKQTCANDFSKCAGDGDTTWGNKLDTCRRRVTCTGEEFQMFAREIKADRDLNAKMDSYTKVLDCGNRYNSCIVAQCGVNFTKCLGKSAGDKAISDCATIAKTCQSIDSGLANRSMQVFATLRQGAEVQAKKDEERLYELRNLMAQQCNRLGAMFDERSLDCVFTVNFFANNVNTPYASKKLYAGDTFDCTQNWFGIDITTYRENAYRLTREQTSASSALMGSGLGIAAGAISSGAIDRAMDRASADKALKKAEKEHKKNFGDDDTDTKDNKPDNKPDKDSDTDTEPESDTNTTPTDAPETAPASQPDGDDKTSSESDSTSATNDSETATTSQYAPQSSSASTNTTGAPSTQPRSLLNAFTNQPTNTTNKKK